jgi:hypothetical protein
MLAMLRRILLFSMLISCFAAQAQVQWINATIDASKTGVSISKKVYGMFLEHYAIND